VKVMSVEVARIYEIEESLSMVKTRGYELMHECN
jgi:hypothetical protein